ncbi:carboxymuconolactone decarboxylase family protein [Desulfobulbus rhabdoformis]|jgi:AhpD family alkylhydroperoxidase|uniref:carboxymuconolactone decarboxylase family protein n=1 Tax=Desulfobulbus rhabdoformis TaxID=34032 RepID=UPI00196504B2|nr:carboxymuconolactone decarboxylase family protein [Desulfobulbus rhabdoformis]MBM9613815.1 carboxymuconolactone decarboxylase family protein [Desulfobulbus rhabdoformis]
MMQDWNAYRDSLMEQINDYASQSPDVMRGLMTINNAGAKTGKLDPKVHELIAIAVAVTTRCDGCIAAHVQKAAELGATKEEISEAMGVAIALNAGAALVYSSRALEAYSQLDDTK